MSGKVLDFKPGRGGSDKTGGGNDNGGNNSGGGGSDMEIRIARLESDVGNIRENIAEIKQDTKDFRLEVREGFGLLRAEIDTKVGAATARSDTQFYWLAGLLIAAIGLGGTAYLQLKEQSYLTQKSVESVSTKLEGMEKHQDKIESRLDSMDAALQEIKKAVTK